MESGADNPIGRLYEMCDERRWPPPDYKLIAEFGMPHEKTFIVRVDLGRFSKEGTARLKQVAKRLACEAMMKFLSETPLEDSDIFLFLVKNNDVFLDVDWDTNSVNNIKPSHDFIELMALWTKLYGGEPSGICDHTFSMISMQYVVQISASNYIPVEMALVNYTWNNGTSDSKFCRLIKPAGSEGNGNPRGFMAEARAHSEATHKIKVGGGPDATANYAQILTKLYEYLSWIDEKAFVFCLEKELEIVQSGLRYLERHAKNIPVKLITILKAEELFMALSWWAGHGHKEISYPLPEQISHEKERIKKCLTRSFDDFTSSNRCAFHQKRDLRFCALSKASLTWIHMDDYLKSFYPAVRTTKRPEKDEKPVTKTALTPLTTLNLPPTSRTSIKPQPTNVSTPLTLNNLPLPPGWGLKPSNTHKMTKPIEERRTIENGSRIKSPYLISPVATVPINDQFKRDIPCPPFSASNIEQPRYSFSATGNAPNKTYDTQAAAQFLFLRSGNF